MKFLSVVGRKGVIAAGHPKTAEAARIMLSEGGNAYDAILAAFCAACVAEPMLASLGGGGYLMAHTKDGKTSLYDFFVQTPFRKKQGPDLDFYPIVADFGSATQEFHVGLGACATPGAVRGLFVAHERLCRLPMTRIVEPAVSFARKGVCISDKSHYFLKLLESILSSNEHTKSVFMSGKFPGELPRKGENMRYPLLADSLEAIAREGADLFYRGEIARRLIADCRDSGGHLAARDLHSYEVLVREPLETSYRNYSLRINPPPSAGGVLVALSLKLLEREGLNASEGLSVRNLEVMAQVMGLTGALKYTSRIGRVKNTLDAGRLLDSKHVDMYRGVLEENLMASRGTTHISVLDGEGNAASMTVTNGEGAGYVIPGSGIMMNNMLGEEDLNPRGFQRWTPNRRMASMMSPGVAFSDDDLIVFGSGGSNRIRTAIFQALVGLIDMGLSVKDAVNGPRLHLEGGVLYAEGGFGGKSLSQLRRIFPDHKVWKDTNVFFGGVHAVRRNGKGVLSGAGDPRRGGVCVRL